MKVIRHKHIPSDCKEVESAWSVLDHIPTLEMDLLRSNPFANATRKELHATRVPPQANGLARMRSIMICTPSPRRGSRFGCTNLQNDMRHSYYHSRLIHRSDSV